MGFRWCTHSTFSTFGFRTKNSLFLMFFLIFRWLVKSWNSNKVLTRWNRKSYCPYSPIPTPPTAIKPERNCNYFFQTFYRTVRSLCKSERKHRVQNTNFEFSNQNSSKSSCLGDQSYPSVMTGFLAEPFQTVSHELQPVTARSLIDHLEPPFF